jgi:hypothetical protein
LRSKLAAERKLRRFFMKRYVDDFIDFGPGLQYHCANIHIEHKKPFSKQLNILREDMFFVQYGDDSLNYFVDVGWYRSFDIKGRFRVVLVKNGDWRLPVLSFESKSTRGLVLAFNQCLKHLRMDTRHYRLLPPTVTS